MKVLPMYGALLYIYGIRALCPTLKVHPKDPFDFESFKKLILYQFKSVDHFVQTPFFELRGATRRSFFGVFGIHSECLYGEFITFFNRAKFINFNNTTNKFDLNYLDDNYFCNVRSKMSKIYLIDFEANYLASLYGCEMFLVNGIMTKVEGVLMFLKFHRNNLTVSTDALSRLSYTYEVLQKQANLSRTTFETQETDMNNKTNESCQNIINMEKSCKNKKLFKENDVVSRFGDIKSDEKKSEAEMVDVYDKKIITLICSGILITIVIVSIACAKQKIIFL